MLEPDGSVPEPFGRARAHSWPTGASAGFGGGNSPRGRIALLILVAAVAALVITIGIRALVGGDSEPSDVAAVEPGPTTSAVEPSLPADLPPETDIPVLPTEVPVPSVEVPVLPTGLPSSPQPSSAPSSAPPSVVPVPVPPAAQPSSSAPRPSSRPQTSAARPPSAPSTPRQSPRPAPSRTTVKPTPKPRPTTPQPVSRPLSVGQISSNVWYDVVNTGNGLCVDDQDFGTVNETDLTQWPCTGASNQQWKFLRNGDGYFRIVSRHAVGKVWDIEGGPAAVQDNAGAHLYSYLGEANQQWRVVERSGGFSFQVRHSGKCLDVPGGRAEAALRLQQFDCNGSPPQTFVLRRIG